MNAFNAGADDVLEEIISDDDDDASKVKDQQVKGKGKKRGRG